MFVEKGFLVNTMKDKTSHNMVVRWSEFIELFKIERNESQKTLKGALTTHSQTLKGLVALVQQKNEKKEKIKVEKKEKILVKLIVEKEYKGFDAVECQLVDNTLGNEFLVFFLFKNDPLLSVSIDVHCFKRSPPTCILSILGYTQGQD
jgi:hypothetical protein